MLFNQNLKNKIERKKHIRKIISKNIRKIISKKDTRECLDIILIYLILIVSTTEIEYEGLNSSQVGMVEIYKEMLRCQVSVGWLPLILIVSYQKECQKNYHQNI